MTYAIAALLQEVRNMTNYYYYYKFYEVQQLHRGEPFFPMVRVFFNHQWIFPSQCWYEEKMKKSNTHTYTFYVNSIHSTYIHAIPFFSHLVCIKKSFFCSPKWKSWTLYEKSFMSSEYIGRRFFQLELINAGKGMWSSVVTARVRFSHTHLTPWNCFLLNSTMVR